MSRIAVVLLAAALVSTAPGLALGAGEGEESGGTSPARSEVTRSCAGSGEARYCPARSEATRSERAQVQEIPIYVPPNRGSPPTRIGGASRGGASPMRRI